MNTRLSIAISALSLMQSAALGQTSIENAHKYCWNENAGWMNWRDAGGTAQGVRDQGTVLAGWVWCENIGWASVGDGSPVSGGYYANTTGADYGVNIAAGGTLSGLAWSENTGWINFSGGALATPAQPARIDFATGRLRGYAWAENVGWVNLDDASSYVGLVCYANCDQSTVAPVLTGNDFLCFMNQFASGDPGANCDRSSVAPVLTANDFTCFLNKFAAGCP